MITNSEKISGSDTLPSFFQFEGKTVADGLLEFELGGELEDESFELVEDEPSDKLEFNLTEADINGLQTIQNLDIDIEKYLALKQTDFNPESAPTESEPKNVMKTIEVPQSKSAQVSNLLTFLKSSKNESNSGDSASKNGPNPTTYVAPPPIPYELPAQIRPPPGYMMPPPPGFLGPPAPGYLGPLPFGYMGPPPPGFQGPPGFFGPPRWVPPVIPFSPNFPPLDPSLPTAPSDQTKPVQSAKGAWAKPPPFVPAPHSHPIPEQPTLVPQRNISNSSANRADEFLSRLAYGSMMRPKDVTYVVRRVLDPMQSVDPFADDYYSIQFNIKKNNTIRDEFLANQTTSQPPPLLFIPLPTWKDAKERIRNQIETAKKTALDKSRKWEEREKVLGHNVKSDFTRPKEVMSVPTLSEMYNMDDDNTDSTMRLPYSNRLWNMRQAVQRGYEALYTVQELQYLSDTPVIANDSINREEVIQDIVKAIAVLAHSLGIRLPNDEHDNVFLEAASSEISLDGGLVAAILQTAKGKRLLARSFDLLPPNMRWALLPAILARVLQVNPNDQAEEDKLVEEKLMKNLLNFIHNAHRYQRELQEQADDKFLDNGGNSSAQFSYLLLGNLRQCLKSVMVTFLDKEQLRQTLLSSRSRAEVLHIIVQVGDRVSEDVDALATSEWAQIRETFMLMLDT